MKKPVIALLGALALVALAAIAAGCGSSSDETESTASISRSEFVKQANEVCEASEKEGETKLEGFLEEEEIEGQELGENEELQEQVAEEFVIPVLSGEVEEVRALGLPGGSDGEEAEEVLDSAESDIEKAEEEPTAIFAEGGEEFGAETDKLSNAYGLTACGGETS